MGYSRDGLENRLNTAYFELDKKIEIALEGSTLAESARQDFREVRKNESLNKQMTSFQDVAESSSVFLFLRVCIYVYLCLFPACLKSINLA